MGLTRIWILQGLHERSAMASRAIVVLFLFVLAGIASTSAAPVHLVEEVEGETITFVPAAHAAFYSKFAISVASQKAAFEVKKLGHRHHWGLDKVPGSKEFFGAGLPDGPEEPQEELGLEEGLGHRRHGSHHHRHHDHEKHHGRDHRRHHHRHHHHEEEEKGEQGHGWLTPVEGAVEKAGRRLLQAVDGAEQPEAKMHFGMRLGEARRFPMNLQRAAGSEGSSSETESELEEAVAGEEVGDAGHRHRHKDHGHDDHERPHKHHHRHHNGGHHRDHHERPHHRHHHEDDGVEEQQQQSGWSDALARLTGGGSRARALREGEPKEQTSWWDRLWGAVGGEEHHGDAEAGGEHHHGKKRLHAKKHHHDKKHEKKGLGCWRKLKVKIIADFDEKIAYIAVVKSVNGTEEVLHCRKRPVVHELKPRDLPASTTLVRSITIGGTLDADVYRLHKKGVKVQLILAHGSNLPISVAAKRIFHGPTITHYFNVAEGIKSPSVFDVPPECKEPSTAVAGKEEAELLEKFEDLQGKAESVLETYMAPLAFDFALEETVQESNEVAVRLDKVAAASGAVALK